MENAEANAPPELAKDVAPKGDVEVGAPKGDVEAGAPKGEGATGSSVRPDGDAAGRVACESFGAPGAYAAATLLSMSSPRISSFTTCFSFPFPLSFPFLASTTSTSSPPLSSFSAWKLYRSFDDTFGAELLNFEGFADPFIPPNMIGAPIGPGGEGDLLCVWAELDEPLSGSTICESFTTGVT